MESHQLSVISNESSGKAPLEMKSECGMQIIETGRIESNPLVINNPWTVRNVRSEGSGSFELPESGCEFDPQTAGGELPESGCEFDPQTADGELPESGCEFDPQTADGELPESGCEFDPQTAGGELPESGREFDPQIAGGESVMPQDCPEFGGSGDGREGGVKAPEDRRSPNPGGCMEGPEKEVSHWGDRRPWLPAGILPGCAPHEAREIPESGGKDLAQNADGEIVTRVKKVICWPMAPWHEGFATRNLRGREPPPELGLPKPGIPFANLSKDRASETRIGWANSIGRSSRLPHAGPPAV